MSDEHKKMELANVMLHIDHQLHDLYREADCFYTHERLDELKAMRYIIDKTREDIYRDVRSCLDVVKGSK
jgi:hypothetical protein